MSLSSSIAKLFAKPLEKVAVKEGAEAVAEQGIKATVKEGVVAGAKVPVSILKAPLFTKSAVLATSVSLGGYGIYKASGYLRNSALQLGVNLPDYSEKNPKATQYSYTQDIKTPTDAQKNNNTVTSNDNGGIFGGVTSGLTGAILPIALVGLAVFAAFRLTSKYTK